MSIVGAGGGFANPNLPQSGYGARIDAVQNFTQGDKLIMVVGQQGLVQSNNNATFFQVVSLRAVWHCAAQPHQLCLRKFSFISILGPGSDRGRQNPY